MKSIHKNVAYFWTLLIIIVVTIIGKLLTLHVDRYNVALLYLLPVLISAFCWGRGPSYFASLLGLLAFDFFFVPPVYSFTIDDILFLFTFAIYLLVAIAISTTTAMLRDELEKTRKHEGLIVALYALSQQMVATTDLHSISESFVNNIAQIIDGKIILLLPNFDNNKLNEAASNPSGSILTSENELDIAQWVLEHGQRAGKGTEISKKSKTLFMPVKTANRTLAVLAVTPEIEDEPLSPEQYQILEAFTNLAAVSLVSVQFEQKANKAE